MNQWPSMRARQRWEVCSRNARGVTLAFAFLLALIPANTADSIVEILEPQDGDQGLSHSFDFHYSAHRPGRISCFIDGRNVYASTEPEQRLNIPFLPLGFHTLEVQLTEEGGEDGGGEVLGYDFVEVFVLGDGILAPEGVEDDVQVQMYQNTTSIDATIKAALQRASDAPLAQRNGHERLMQITESEKELERVITMLGNVPGSLVPRCYYSLAQVLLARGDAQGFERAIGALREAVWHSVTQNCPDAAAPASFLHSCAGTLTSTWASARACGGALPAVFAARPPASRGKDAGPRRRGIPDPGTRSDRAASPRAA
jgi:hypothetical protein